MDGQLWSVAVLLSRLMGDAAVSATAAAMARQCVPDSQPLHTLLLMLGGASPEQALHAAVASAEGGPSPPVEPAAASGAAAPAQQPGMFNPLVAAATPRAVSRGDAWRRHLAVIAANRTPGDEAAVLLLGGRLLAAGRLLPAQVCFALAGAPLQPFDVAADAAAAAAATAFPAHPGAMPPGAAAQLPAGAGGSPTKRPPPTATLVLLGADVAARPRACTHLPAVLASEVYTWCRTVGERGLLLLCCFARPVPCLAWRTAACSRLLCLPSPPHTPRAANPGLAPQFLCVLPYKLVHAAALADLGLIPQAVAYCQALGSTLQVGGCVAGRVPVWRFGRSSKPTSPLHLLTHSHRTAGPPPPTLQSLGGKLPPALLICRATASDLNERLTQYAAVSSSGGTVVL